MSFLTINEAWVEFCASRKDGPDSAQLPSNVEWLMKVAFYAGACTMWTVQGNIMHEQKRGKLTSGQCSAALSALFKEAADFMESQAPPDATKQSAEIVQ